MLFSFKIVLTTLLLVVASCAREDDHDRDYDRADKTPGGLHVQFDDQGTISKGLMTKDQIYRVFDAVFLEAGKAFAFKNKVSLDSFLSAPHDHKIVFRLIDQWHFQSPINGWVEGEAHGDDDGRTGDWNTVLLSWWRRKPLDPIGPPPNNPWTISADAVYGGLYHGGDPGQIAGIIGHEMGHVFFGPKFGH
jgi:hypothetical protein